MVKTTQKMGGGLQELARDKRDCRLGNILRLPELRELPDEYILETEILKHQLDDFCSANVTSLLLSIQEGVEIDELWLFAASKAEDPESWGQDLRTAMLTPVRHGAIEKGISPFSKNKGSKFLRSIQNWPDELFWAAKKHKQQSMFMITGPYDHFDNIRASLWAFRDLKRGCALGLKWSWPMSSLFLKTVVDRGTGHMITGLGFTKKRGEDFLVIQNSYGKNVGKNGRHYVSRDVINTFVEKYGAAMFVDMPKEDAKVMSKYHIPVKHWWLARFINSIKRFFSLCN